MATLNFSQWWESRPHNVFDPFILLSFICYLSITGRRNFRKQYNTPIALKQRALNRRLWEHLTFYMMILFHSPFVERFRQKWVYTGWKLKPKSSLGKYIQTYITSRHVETQSVCGDVQMWRTCLQATTRTIHTHTHTLSLLLLFTSYTVNVCVTIYINTASWIINLLTITALHTSTSLWHHNYNTFLPNKFPAWSKLVLFV